MSFPIADIYSALTDLDAESVTLRRVNGETLSATALFDPDYTQFDGVRSRVGERSMQVMMQRSEVGRPEVGDVIIRADGTNVTVDEIAADDGLEITLIVSEQR